MRRHFGRVFRARVQRLRFQPQTRQRVFQKQNALVQRVQKRHLQIRPQNQQRHAGKARARAHVDDLRAGHKQPVRQRRGAVQIVAVHALILVEHGGQIHARVVFIQNGVKGFKTVKRSLVRRDAHFFQPVFQSLFIHSGSPT